MDLTTTAMVLEAARSDLVARRIVISPPGPGEVRLRVTVCGVCRTDLHLVDGELPPAPLPVVPGHEVVGEVIDVGRGVDRFSPGDRVGVPWLGWTCGECPHCRAGRENLCERARFTGYTLDGGFAVGMLADARYCFPIPDGYADLEAAPLMCAGLIGYRTYRMAGPSVERLGIYGFGAAAHIVAQIAVFEGAQVYAFTRPGDAAAQEFARRMGAVWAGGSDERAPVELDAALLFAPVGALVPIALGSVRGGGSVVCGGIYMSDIPSFPYELLWHERQVRSVANLERRDGGELLEIAARARVRCEVEPHPLRAANEVLARLRDGRLNGAAVLTMDEEV